MERSDWIALSVAGGLIVLSVVIVIGAAIPPEPVTFRDGFQNGTERWVVDADVPRDPNANGTVAWNITPTDRIAHRGNRSLMFALDGSQDDGTIWITRSFQAEFDTRYRVNVSAHAYSRSESFNTLAHMVMFAGERAPVREENFPAPGTVVTSGPSGGLRQPLDAQEGWKRYSFTWTTPPLDRGEFHVAVGISAVWETRLAYPVDTVTVTATPVG